MALRPVGPKRSTKATLERASRSLQKAAKALEKKGERSSRDDFAKASDLGAKALQSTARYTGAGASGVGGWHSGEVREGGRYVAKNVAKGLAGLAGLAQRLTFGGALATVRSLERDPNAVRFSQQPFGRAGRAEAPAEAMATAWASYVESVGLLAAGQSGPGPSAQHVAAVAGSLAKAAALTVSPSATKMAEFGVRLADAAVQVAQVRPAAARQLVVLAARFDAATAGVLSSPDPQAAQVAAALASTRLELRGLLQANPALQPALSTLLG